MGRRLTFLLVFSSVFLTGLFSCGPLWGHIEDNLRILTMLDGLPDNTITSIYRDTDGFLWLGTHNGLCRYDGIKPISYTDPAKYLKVGNITESPEGLLWIIANEALLLFDKKHECFIPVSYPPTNALDNIYDVLVCSDSLAYVLSRGQLYRLDRQARPSTDDGAVWFTPTLVPKPASGSGFLAALAPGEAGQLVVASKAAELFFYDTATSSLQRVARWTRKMNQWINDLQLIDGNIWICSDEEGAICYNVLHDSYVQYNYAPGPTSQLSNQNAMGVTPFENHSVLIVTYNGYTQLIPVDGSPGRFVATNYNHNYSPVHQEVETRMLSVYFDPQNSVLWMGTRGGGVLQTQLGQRFYQQYHQQSHNEISDMVLDKQGYVWVACYRRGVMKSTQPFAGDKPLALEQMPVPKPITSNTFRCVTEDRHGLLWFGGLYGQLLRYNPITKAYQSWRITDKPEAEIWNILFDTKGRLWAATSAGLYYFDDRSEAFYCALPGYLLFDLREDRDGFLWIGTGRGLMKTSSLEGWAPGGTLTETAGFESEMAVDAGAVRTLFLSNDGNLYVGYENGLGVVSLLSQKQVAFFSTRNGLCNNYIACLCEDMQGQLWVGSNSGVSCYNKTSGLFSHYYVSGNNRSVLQAGSYLLWGNHKSITYFDSSRAEYVRTPISAKIYLSSLEVNHQLVAINTRINSQVILNKSITYTDTLVLNRRNYRFSVSYVGLNYAPTKQSLSYRLMPREQIWNRAEEGQQITYARLPKGHYTLEACPLLPLGKQGPVTRLQVIILPAWYETMWFITLLIILLLASLYLVQMWFAKRNERKMKENAMQQEIRTLHREKEHAHQMHQERVRFYTGISHELRTPLTLILAPLKELEKGRFSEDEVREKLHVMQKSTDRLSNVVDQMLMVQKMEVGMVKLHIDRVNLAAIVQHVVEEFSSLLRLKEMDCRMENVSAPVEVMADEKYLSVAVRNIISNAIKYTPEHGHIIVKVYTHNRMETDYACVSVTDDGPGIKETDQAGLFDLFTTTANEPTFSTKLGVGLRVVKHVMDMHHGYVSLDSRPGQGACFMLNIPMDTVYVADKQPGPTDGVSGAEDHTEPYKKTKVLIIEDNDDMQAYLKSLFLKQYTVFQAFDGEAGLDKAREVLPDLVLCDVMMPVKDGFACCHEMKADPKLSHIPVMMLTAKTEEQDIIQSTQVGADDYIFKPFNPEVLLAKAAALLRSREQLKRLYTKSFILTNGDHPDQEEPSPFLQKALNIVESNLTNEQFDVVFLADALHMSPQTLYKKIRSESGLNVVKFIRSVRMSNAASLLLKKQYSIQEVAYLVGYSDLPTFRKHFAAQFGTTPSKFG